MSNIPQSLCDSSLTLFRIQILERDSCLLRRYLGLHHISSSNNRQEEEKKEGRKEEMKDVVPKGFLVVMVGQGQEKQRFVVPLVYLNHPLFVQLLKEAEEEYGFGQKGPISIPCHVEQFQNVQRIIEGEQSHHHHHCFRS
ncbi:hypothetical protein AAC387_Pa01g3395 [Persea americana]